MIVVAGSINMDLVARVPRLPAPGQTVLGSQFLRHPGGKGANQAVAAARQEVPVALHGAVGEDAFGDELVDGLRREGIDVAGIERADEPTGCALIHVADDGENAIAVLPGANTCVAPPIGPWRAKMLLLQGEIPLATNLAWARAARALGIPVLFNAAPAADWPDELLACVDTLVVNAGELEALAGGGDGALASAASRGPRRVVVTRGAAGGQAWNMGRLVDWSAHPVRVVDTTGAGDAFVGVLAAGLADGLAFEPALRRAAVAAALACTALGARAGLPTRAALDAACR